MKPSTSARSKNRIRLILGGGGNARQSLALDRQLADWMAPGSTLLYWPFALPESHPLLKGCQSWIASVFHPLGVTHIETWYANDLATNAKRFPLDSFAAIYIGGGNTFRLLELICSTGLDRALSQFIASGGPVSGGSAGAVVLGKDIGFADDFGDRNASSSRDTAGLDVMRDEAGNPCLVLPHFVESWRTQAQRLSSDTNTTVICIEEDAGVIVDGSRWHIVGSGQVTLVRPDRGFSD